MQTFSFRGETFGGARRYTGGAVAPHASPLEHRPVSPQTLGVAERRGLKCFLKPRSRLATEKFV